MMKIRILPSLVRRLIGRKRRHIKIEDLGKLDGCMMLQTMCKRYELPFEKATEYSLFRDFKILKHRHAKRILVRTEDSRKEYVTDGVTKGRLEDISAEIRRFVHDKRFFVHDKRFIVQEVGLREDISSFGSILISHKGSEVELKLKESIAKSTHKVLDAMGRAFVSAKTQKILKIDHHGLSENKARELTRFLGTENAPLLIEELAGHLRKGKEKSLRFVRYKDSPKAVFYDMSYLI